jgi:mannose-6-phosphate isomerase-like protein (cupin superfamily)
MLVAPVDDSPLGLEDVRLGPGATFALAEDAHDSLLFAYAGGGLLSLESGSHRLDTRSAALVLAGENATVTGDDAGVSFVRALVGPETDRHALLGDREIVAGLDDGSGGATGARSFEILFGPDNGSTRATLFIGYVPPGKAPWHYHLYDEIVLIRAGSGRLLLEGHTEEISAGSAFRLRPRQLHIVENTGSDTLELLGVFTPAGTPAAAYLPVLRE